MANLVRRETGANDLFDFRLVSYDKFHRFLTGAVPTATSNRVLVAVHRSILGDRENKKFT